MATYKYCAHPSDQGLTCLHEDLILLRRLSEDDGPAYKNIVFLFQCKVCQGLYKYIYARGYQTRNLDQEEGWFVYCDRYFKVGEEDGSGSIQFPLAEARIYGNEE